MSSFTPHTRCYSYIENDEKMQELVYPFPPLHPIIQEDLNHSFHPLMEFSIDNFAASYSTSDQVSGEMDGSVKKRKPDGLPEISSRNKRSWGRGKRVRSKEKQMVEEEKKKPKEVVHVRAKRGQATNSHSLAERVRRGKINEKLKCLQDMVPGCYKEMGMTVMLDEIINYVQSLQNQVEFLSMKLAAASALQDFTAQPDCFDNLQKGKANEAEDVDMLLSSEGYDQVHVQLQAAQAALACFQSTWPLILP